MYFLKLKPETLSLKEAFVYSLLVTRYNHGKGTSRRSIGHLTGINRVITLPKLVASLYDKGLVEEKPKNRLLYPKQPTGQAVAWFYWRKQAQADWWKRFSFFSVKMRTKESPLSIEQNILYWRLHNLYQQGKTWQTLLGLSKLLNLHRLTIKNALLRFQSLGLLEITPRLKGFDIKLPFPDHAQTWFVIKVSTPIEQVESGSASTAEVYCPEPTRLAKVPDGFSADWRESGYARIIERIIQDDPTSHWLQQEFPTRIYELLVQDCYVNDHLMHDDRWFAQLAGDCKRQHHKTGYAPTYAYLILDKMKKLIAGQKSTVRVERTEEDKDETTITERENPLSVGQFHLAVEMNISDNSFASQISVSRSASSSLKGNSFLKGSGSLEKPIEAPFSEQVSEPWTTTDIDAIEDLICQTMKKIPVKPFCQPLNIKRRNK